MELTEREERERQEARGRLEQEERERKEERERLDRDLAEKSRTASALYLKRRTEWEQSDACKALEEATLKRQKEEEAARKEQRKEEIVGKVIDVLFTLGRVICLVIIGVCLWYGGAWLIARFLETVQSFR